MKKILILIVLVLTLTSCDTTVEYSTELNDGKDIITLNETWVDAGCLVTIDGEEFEMVLDSSTTPDITTDGEYTVSYTYQTDDNEFTCKRVVKVIEQVYPTVTLNPGVDTVINGEDFVDAGVTATDDQIEDLTITVNSDVDTTQTGSYLVVYTVTDLDGNQTIITRVVTVIN